MTNDDFKKLLKDIKELIEVVSHKVDKVETNQSIYSAQLVLIKDKQSVLNDKLDNIDETLEDHTRRLEALAGDVEQLHLDVKGIKEKESLFHSRNKREIDEIKTHLDLPLMPDIPEI